MKKIIVYFSYSNNTKKLVEKIEKSLNIKTVRIERATPYSSDYDTCAYVEAKEEWLKRLCPEIKPLNINFNEYDEIDLFFPIWWYTYPMPIATFIKSLNDYKGVIKVYANSYINDYQYMINSLKDLKELNHNITFKEGLFNKGLNEHLLDMKGD